MRFYKHTTNSATRNQQIEKLRAIDARLAILEYRRVNTKLKSAVRWSAIVFGGLLILTVLFYAEENWRGKRAWEDCKGELEAKGTVLDWDKFIPPPVQDEQNFFKAPKMTEWFVRSTDTISNPNTNGLSQRLLNACTTNNPVVLAEWTWQYLLTAKNIAAAESENADIVLKYSSTPSHLHTFVEANIPPVAEETPQTNIIRGVRGEWLMAKSHAEIKPARIILLSGMKPDPEIVAWFTQCFPTNTTGGGSPRIHVEPPIGTIPFPKTFRVILDSAYSAADFLAWSDQFAPAFDDVRAALKRPYAIIPGDYSVSWRIPIPNFVTLRVLAQTLAQRTQCYLLLGQPEKALQEMALIHDVCRILEKPPTGRPETLVEAMINVAITGVYVNTIQDGLRLHAWQEPQLAAIQKQLNETCLLPFVNSAFRMEQVSIVNIGEKFKARKLFTGDGFGIDRKMAWYERLWSHRYDLIPRGWMYQNIKYAVALEQPLIDCFDPANAEVYPKKLDAASARLEKSFEHWSLFQYLAAIAIPNFTKAFHNCAFNQTLANQAQIVCALERYKLASGRYPETLDALVPQFIGKLPHDIIGGKPLHYRRTGDGKFVLYSIGWNEKDDGGVVVFRKNSLTAVDTEKGDWVWQYPVN